MHNTSVRECQGMPVCMWSLITVKFYKKLSEKMLSQYCYLGLFLESPPPPAASVVSLRRPGRKRQRKATRSGLAPGRGGGVRPLIRPSHPSRDRLGGGRRENGRKGCLKPIRAFFIFAMNKSDANIQQLSKCACHHFGIIRNEVRSCKIRSS